MLNKDIMTKLTTALRSGEYKQTKEVLKDADGGMCCLGVLCDIYQKETGKGSWSDTTTRDKRATKSCYPFETPIAEGVAVKTDFPAQEVLLWAGFEVKGVGDVYPHTPFASDLAGSNDAGSTFDQIADMIDEQMVREEKE